MFGVMSTYLKIYEYWKTNKTRIFKIIVIKE